MIEMTAFYAGIDGQICIILSQKRKEVNEKSAVGTGLDLVKIDKYVQNSLFIFPN